ncbi:MULTISPECIES: DUF2249 domain-containing protein [Haloferacaceae]|uniref:DUF2249 domain-containing protein n=1 Tax=Halorubrum glutamatedens TaxID=2707018 RepID=A0ABD5QP26_9EURY|nr:DUF2249 domain-containing protein [Halobellus captivus]
MSVDQFDRGDQSDAGRRLDVREIDGEPFGEIMAALEGLPDDGSLLLVNSFEPEPLYDVLERRGFRYETTSEESAEGDGSTVWYVEIAHA